MYVFITFCDMTNTFLKCTQCRSSCIAEISLCLNLSLLMNWLPCTSYAFRMNSNSGSDSTLQLKTLKVSDKYTLTLAYPARRRCENRLFRKEGREGRENNVHAVHVSGARELNHGCYFYKLQVSLSLLIDRLGRLHSHHQRGLWR